MKLIVERIGHAPLMTETTMTIEPNDRDYYATQIKELRRCASAVYLACAESVAADISDKLTRAADSIDRLTPPVPDQ